jgi:hypothetical protein
MRIPRFLIPLLAASAALAHIPLTPAIVDDAFEEIAGARAAIRSAADPGPRAAATYAFAIEATKLTELLNQEIRLHGHEQQDLLADAVATAASQGIDLVWSEDHERYFYAGDAFRQYLELVSTGPEAANSLFHLIETGFYLGDPGDHDGLLARIDMEREFLERHPDVGNAERVVMFLAIDYRDLWRLCKTDGDADCASRYAGLTREHLEATMARYGEARAGRLARSFLQRFEAEFADDPRSRASDE